VDARPIFYRQPIVFDFLVGEIVQMWNFVNFKRFHKKNPFWFDAIFSILDWLADRSVFCLHMLAILVVWRHGASVALSRIERQIYKSVFR
jgi:hypothetical protein